MGRLKTIIAFAIAGMVVPCAAHAATVTITGSNASARANDYSDRSGGGVPIDLFTGTSIPTSQSLKAVQGGNTSDAAVTYSSSGAQTTLSFDFNQTRTGDARDISLFYNSGLSFSVSEDTTYELSGYMNVDDIGSDSGRVYFETRLFNNVGTTNSTYSAHSMQESYSAGDESFKLGLQEGDTRNSFAGALTGLLLKDQVYQWFVHAQIEAHSFTDSGATAMGNFTLKIGAENAIGAVPVPPAFALLVPGLALLGFFGMRGKRSAAA